MVLFFLKLFSPNFIIISQLKKLKQKDLRRKAIFSSFNKIQKTVMQTSLKFNSYLFEIMTTSKSKTVFFLVRGQSFKITNHNRLKLKCWTSELFYTALQIWKLCSLVSFSLSLHTQNNIHGKTYINKNIWLFKKNNSWYSLRQTKRMP